MVFLQLSTNDWSVQIYTIGEKSSLHFFIEKPCSVLPKFYFNYYSGKLLEHLNFTPDFKMVSFSF